MTSRGLGAGFGRLWAASISSNLSDGLVGVAVPLIAASLTRDPLLIAVVTALRWLPWLLFGVVAGAIVDRVDRRRAMSVANLVRGLAAMGAVAMLLTGTLDIWALYLFVLVFGIGETFYDNATIAMVPSLVDSTGLERANSRMQSSDLVVQSFIATPISSVLFAVSSALPLAGTGAGYLAAAAISATLPDVAGRAERSDDQAARPGIVTEIREALRFLRGHPLLRRMVVLTSTVGALLSFAQATLVLFVLETLAVPEAAVGAVFTAVGVGAVIGSLTSPRLVARFGPGRIMLVGTVAGGVGIAAAGSTTTVWVSIPLYALSAWGISTWNVPWGALRQRIIPGHLLGRLIGAIRTITWGVMPLATLAGGLASRVDLRLPLVLGGVLIAVVSLGATRLLMSVDRFDGPRHVGGAA